MRTSRWPPVATSLSMRERHNTCCCCLLSHGVVDVFPGAHQLQLLLNMRPCQHSAAGHVFKPYSKSLCIIPCCSAIDRCAYPEMYNGTWNMTLTYQTQTLLTRAHFYLADPAAAATTGNTFEANYDDHSWNYDVEHVSGLTIRVRPAMSCLLEYHRCASGSLCKQNIFSTGT